jgi:hypothetical protein
VVLRVSRGYESGTQNHTLTLVLKVCLNQATPNSSEFQLDHDLRPFVIEKWPPGEFEAFKRVFTADAARWNNRFWLIPPAGYSGLDVKVGNRTMRPNIYCHLYVDATSNANNAHCTIRVVYLQKSFAKAMSKVTNTKPTGGTFRSNAGLFDSMDGIRLCRSTRSHARERNQEDATMRGRVAGRTERASPDRHRRTDDNWRARVPVASAMPVPGPRRVRCTRSASDCRCGAPR